VSNGIQIEPGSVVAVAADPKHGMTFGELRAFVTSAMHNHTRDDEVVHAVATWRNSCKRMEVKGGLSPEQEISK
jgi:hypothetical protein